MQKNKRMQKVEAEHGSDFVVGGGTGGTARSRVAFALCSQCKMARFYQEHVAVALRKCSQCNMEKFCIIEDDAGEIVVIVCANCQCSQVLDLPSF
jgi:hypothetical protein